MSNSTIGLIVKLVRVFGLPLVRMLPFLKGLPQSFWDTVEAVLKSIEEAQDKKGAMIRAAHHMKTCEGVGCHMDLVRDR